MRLHESFLAAALMSALFVGPVGSADATTPSCAQTSSAATGAIETGRFQDGVFTSSGTGRGPPSGRHVEATGDSVLFYNDITEHPTAEGRIYLRAIKDA